MRCCRPPGCTWPAGPAAGPGRGPTWPAGVVRRPAASPRAARRPGRRPSWRAGDLEAAAAAGTRAGRPLRRSSTWPRSRARSDAVAARGCWRPPDDPRRRSRCSSRRSTGCTARRSPWLRATLLVDLARWRERAGDAAGARVDARSAAALLRHLDVALEPADRDLLERLAVASAVASAGSGDRHGPAGRWSSPVTATAGRSPTPGTGAPRDSKGLRYLAELLRQPGVEHHALDLVDRVEGVAAEGGVDRRRLGDAGELLDGTGPRRLPPPRRGAPRRHRRRARGRPTGVGRGAPGRARRPGRRAGAGVRARRARPPGGVGGGAGPPQRDPGRAHGDPQGGRGPARGCGGARPGGPHRDLLLSTSPRDDELRWVVPPAGRSFSAN